MRIFFILSFPLCITDKLKFATVPGRNACEIHMFHQEDAGLNAEMAKLAFSKGIWSYVCKMENALRKYIATSHRPQGPAVSAVSLMKKVRC